MNWMKKEEGPHERAWWLAWGLRLNGVCGFSCIDLNSIFALITELLPSLLFSFYRPTLHSGKQLFGFWLDFVGTISTLLYVTCLSHPPNNLYCWFFSLVHIDIYMHKNANHSINTLHAWQTINIYHFYIRFISSPFLPNC